MQDYKEKDNISIPVPATTRRFNTGKGSRPRQLFEKELVAVKVAVNIYFDLNNIVDTTEQKYFKPAELVIPSPSAKDQRWYIKFYCYDVQRQEIVRKRFYQLPYADSILHRKYLCQKVANEINQLLAQGKVIDALRGEFEHQKRINTNSILTEKVSVVTVVSKVFALKQFKEIRTKQTYSSIVDNLKRFLNEFYIDLPISSFDLAICKIFQKWLEDNDKSPRTINNHILTLRTIWSEAIDLNFCSTNPWRKVPKLKTSLGKNIAYLPHQQKEIIAYAALHYPEMEFLIKIMYYTLARTNEIAHMQIKHIGMYVPNKIYIESSISKNDIERHIIIHPGLEEEFEKRNIRHMNPEMYLVSKDRLKVGFERAVTNKLGRRYREWILNPLGYPKEYNLYSWKHTGIISAHKAGVSDDDIMKQTGHQDYGSFQKYLKSLGLFDNDDFVNKQPKL